MSENDKLDGSLQQSADPFAYAHGDVHPIPVAQQLGVALGILVLMFGVTFIGDFTTQNGVTFSHNATAEAVEESPLVAEPAAIFDPFAQTNISARSAFVWDVKSQRALYTKNPDEQLPLASITKLMTALVAYELLDSGQTIYIPSDAIEVQGDSGLTDGESFSFKNLTDLTLIGSSNDGAYALAAAAGNSITDTEDGESIFIEAMNIRAEEIGLSQTYFNNATGLDISETEAGAYGSSRDMTFLLEYIISHYPGLLDETTTAETVVRNEQGDGHLVENTNWAINDIQGIIASKTGYTDLAGGNLIVAFDAGLNRPIIVTVLGSSRRDRFTDVITLAEKARETVAQQ